MFCFFNKVNIYAIAELMCDDTAMSVESKELHEKVVLKPVDVLDSNETTGGKTYNKSSLINNTYNIIASAD